MSNDIKQHQTTSKLLLAFSGGLDTTYCAIWLREQGYEVHTALVDTGGFSAEELHQTNERAERLGVASHIVLDRTEAYYQNIIRYLIYGNVLKNNSYPLSVSAERVYQSIALAEYARQIGATAIAHGSTGAGNDQVRFDMAFRLLIPDVEIITPVRDQQLSREAEITFLRERGVDFDFSKAQYSVNRGLWGTSVGGAETLTSHLALPESAYPTQVSQHQSTEITLEFEQGEPVALNGERGTPVEIIQRLETLAAPYGIGRDVHVGDTIIGIKGRVGFEAAAATTIIEAHRTLEKHTLGKWQIHWKDQLAQWYGMFLHEAQYFDPVMRNLETFLADTQERVSGIVHLTLHPYRAEIRGIESLYDLMNSGFGDYGEMNRRWTGEDVRGFTKILANSALLHRHVGTTEKSPV